MTAVSRRQLLIGAGAVALAAAGLTGAELLRPAPARASAPSCSVFPHTYPSVLRTSGPNLVDASGNLMPRMRGFNVQPVPWPQSAYTAMAAEGASIVRTVVFWSELEPAEGSIDAAYLARLDLHIARVQAAGMYTVLNFYFGPDGKHMPAWAQDAKPASRMSNYVAHGQYATQYLAKRYGDPSDPLGAKRYTPIVAGFGVNEPTPDYSNQADWVVHLLGQQATMVSWFRAYAPAWIALLSCGFDATAPIANAPGSGQTGQTFTSAPKNPLAAQGGNFVLDLHDYFKSTTLSTRPDYDGRLANGQTDWTSQGGPEIRVHDTDHPHYPPATLDRATCQAQQRAFLAPYVSYCAAANVPLCIGEWGWIPQENGTVFAGGSEYVADKQAAWAGAHAAIEMEWDYGTDQSTDPFAAYPGSSAPGAAGNGWQTVTNEFFASC